MMESTQGMMGNVICAVCASSTSDDGTNSGYTKVKKLFNKYEAYTVCKVRTKK